ncbi:MAG: DUF4388 domain-containing protein [Kofleriaceae bacterium]
MSGSSKVIVVYPDGPDGDVDGARAGSQIQLGFEREGIPTDLVTSSDSLPLDNAGLVIVGGADGKAVELLQNARSQLSATKLDIPLVFAGKNLHRADAEQAGADEVVLYPAYLRDVVTVGRLLRGVPRVKREHIVGSLAETTGMYTLVRALAALGRSAVLTLIRGLRRGEIRFFHGEVTSAELALIHGQAALHQLLLWTEARFEYLKEDVVRRQQIPLTHEELFADAERFLEGVRDSSGSLSPSMVLEQDVTRIHSLGRQVPTEVHGVLRMFDGHRVLADILEDSPYRVFETLRVAQRAVEAGLLRIVEKQRSRAKWRAVLSIEEWLTGQDRDAVVERVTSLIDSSPVSATADTGQVEKSSRDSKPKFKKGKKRKKKESVPPPAAEPPPAVARTSSKPNIDWGSLVPRIIGGDVGSLSQVVPAAQRSGEISREKLEALDTGARERIFPKDAEPSIVIEPDTEETVAPAAKASEAKASAETVEAKATEAKANEPKTSEAKATEPKTVEAKATEAKAAESKTVEAKATETKAGDSKSVEATAAESKTVEAKATDKDAEKKASDNKRVEEAKAIPLPPPRPSSPAIDLSPRTSSPAIDTRASSPAIELAVARTSTPRMKSPSAPPPITGIPDIPRSKSPSAPPPITGVPDIPRSKSPSAPPPITGVPDLSPSKSPSAPPPITGIAATTASSASTASNPPTTASPPATGAPSPSASSSSSSSSASSAAITVPPVELLGPTPLSSIAPTPLTSILPSATDATDAPTFLRTPRPTRVDSQFDDSDATNVVPRVEPSSVEPAVARTKTPTAPPPSPVIARTKTPTAPSPSRPLSPEEREAEQDAEDARLRAEAVELAKKQAAARAAEQDRQAREAMDLANRLAEARAKAQPPLKTDESVPITLATPDPDEPGEIDESVPIRRIVPGSRTADADGSLRAPLQTPDPDAGVDEEALWRVAEARAREAAADQKTMPVPKLEADDLIRELIGEKITIAETNTSRVVLQEQMSIDRSLQTARIASSQITTVEKAPAAHAKDDVSAATALFGKRELAAPTEIDDEPSDGIVRHIPSVETAPKKRPPPPKVEVPDDRPGDRTGEITAARKKHGSTPPKNREPSILIEEAAATTAADLAAAHEAVAAAAVAQVRAPKTTDLAGASVEKAVVETRKDAAIAFSDAEEAFFRQGFGEEKSTSVQMTGPVETFDDLDEDYQPVGFWDRLRGKKGEKKPDK